MTVTDSTPIDRFGSFLLFPPDDKLYSLHLELFGAVMPTPGPEVLGSRVSVTLAKVGAESWPRLLADSSKGDKNKIKVDWERWVDEDADADQNDAAKAAREKLELSEAWANEATRMGGGSGSSGMAGAMGGLRVTDNPALAALPRSQRLKASYLMGYNIFVLTILAFVLFLAFQAVWLHSFSRRAPGAAMATATAAAAGGAATDAAAAAATAAVIDPLLAVHESHEGGWRAGLEHGLGSLHQRAGSLEYTVQGLATLEILHALFGLIQGRVLPSILLNGGRDIILFGVIAALGGAHVQSHWSVGALYVLWCFGDLVRYVYYLMQLITSSPAARAVADGWISTPLLQVLLHEPTQARLLKLRYTIPLFLLPLGFATELAVLWQAMLPAGKIALFGDWTLAHGLQLYALFAYLVGAPFLYMAVLQQRKSKLGKAKKSKADAKKTH